MTDTTPPADPYGAPSPQPGGASPGAPPAPGAPAPPTPAEPAKKSSAGRIILIVVAVVIVGILAVIRFVIPAIQDAQFKVDACLDYYPTGIFESDIDPKVVDCGDAAALSRIIAVFEDSTTADLEALCPAEATAGLQRKSKLYCLVEV